VLCSNCIVLGNNAKVAIGNTNPQNKLEITSGADGTSGLRLTNLKSNMIGTTNGKALSVDANGDIILVNVASTSSLREKSLSEYWVDENEYIVNKNSKGVIIGTGINKTPSNYKLFVEGGILTEDLNVAIKNTDAWSDKVFDKKYKLKPIEEVEEFINKNKHLPGVPSAETVVNEGINVAKMNAKLLEKIEELTLYVIELKKENKEIKQYICKIKENKE
jgi:hypothetical protein